MPLPEILYTPYEQLPDAIIWKNPTEKLIGDPIDFEFMRRNCLVFHRSTLVNLNNWNKNLKSIIMNSQRFSEFNLIGAYAWKFERDKYNFRCTDNIELPPVKAIQVWSYASKAPGADDLHLREYIRILEAIIKAFAI
jgi:hypothetical protein